MTGFPVQLNRHPGGVTLDSIGGQKLVRVTDGDTPVIEMSIRMLSVDTPEVTARSAATAGRRDQEFLQLAGWIRAGQALVEPSFADYILPKLETGRAGTLQFSAGKAASLWLTEEMTFRLAKPSGGQRQLFVRTTKEAPFDDNGRLLAYIAPSYAKNEMPPKDSPQRETFNLGLVRAGMAAPFIIYPGIPSDSDLAMMIEATESAVSGKHGQWADDLMLPGYEYRMCEKLFRITRALVDGQAIPADDQKKWRDRFCADIRTKVVHGPEHYQTIPHAHRLWIWSQDIDKATQELGLTAGPGIY